uniref:NADH-ubiquinone oxidoreductase chain 2 n=2 Tax=Californiconus californicus TaxID=1736779 RepID=A0A1L3N1L5_CONCL|nr:NADH dehydrogenase subunit 2 [Californiconus californicus]APH08600.1 NADH dehydrogenase subunit 2 [Californiconus californicus]
MFSSLPFGYLFMCVMSLGTLLSVSSMHWLSIWAGLEINLIGFLPMLVYQKSISESESAVKYFIIQALGSSFLIFGSLMVFSLSFSWDVYSSFQYGLMGFCILTSGLCIKLGVFPFHFWLPSVMAGLPWLSCLLLATWQKLAPLFLLLSTFEANQSQLMLVALCGISAGSALMGGVGGMNQTQIRALLAYSSIGHLGWMMYAAIHGEWALKTYLGIYVLVSLSLFGSLWLSDSENMKNISSLKDSKFMHAVIMILLLSLAGLPPLLGFVSKWLIIQISTSSSMLSVVLFLILGSLLSLYYYLSLLFSLLLAGAKKEEIQKKEMSVNKWILIILIMNVVGGIGILLTNLLNVL